MKSILVTGGAGFIGANFVPYFAKKYPEYKVINLDKLTYAGNPDNLSDCAECANYKFVQGDICDRALIEKLCTLCSAQDAKLMQRDVYVSGRVKSMNETIYYDVDAIQEAIAQNRQITFRYFDWGLNGTRVYRDKSYTASPYGLCQNNENCYLLALSPRHGITSYRVDRMSNIAISPEERIPCPELTGRRLTEYASRMFQMYSGETTAVKLRFRRELANVVIDRFGKDTMLLPDGEDWFVFTAEVAVSPQFLSWVMGFGEKAKILYPQSVAEQCKELCERILEQYA